MNKFSRYLADNGLSQIEAAQALNCEQSTVSRWQSGRARPSAEMIQRIARWTNGYIQPNDWFVDQADAAVSPKGGA